MYTKDYARTINSYPNKGEKLQLLAKVQAIPGNDAFTLDKLASWFNRHRNPAHAASRAKDRHSPMEETPIPRFVDDDSILFPKLTPTHLAQLQGLYRKRPEPAEGIITFWATRLNADRDEVAAWIQYQQVKARAAAVATSPTSESASPTTPTMFPKPHLPTPAMSMSPPHSPEMRMHSLPPIAVKMEGSRRSESPPTMGPVVSPPVAHKSSFPLMPLTSQTTSISANLPPVARLHHPAPQPKIPLKSPPDAQLMGHLRNSMLQDIATSERIPPSTAEEFDARFRPYERSIQSFVQNVESGRLKHLGWDASQISET
ncbi:hypothetical protein F5I97DRAFT_1903455 [Phlebopus sp. FC_14]|nr:hypothetical protein F5I97DRAFT_1903455 [Phlebopus sp. FC_14]